MAESVEDSSPTKYFCHQCSREVTPLYPSLELICPDCASSFLEEVSQDLYEARGDHISEPDDEDDDPLNDYGDLRDEILSLQNAIGVQDLFSHALNSMDAAGDVDSESSFLDPILRAHPAEFLPYRTFEESRDGLSFYADYLEDNIDSLVTQFLDEVEISGPEPLPDAQIKSLPIKPITKEDVDKGIQCTVCMDDFILREKVKCLPCQHFYHEKCITPWLERHATCPNCRETIQTKPNYRSRRSLSCPRPSTHSDEESQPSSESSASSSSSSSSLSDFFSTSINPFRFLH